MTTTQDPIATAARLLREAAEGLRQAHTLSSDRNNWIGEPEAKAAYDEHMAAAQALEDWEAAVGAGGVQPLRSVQEGCKLVPLEPTQEMLAALMSPGEAEVLASSPSETFALMLMDRAGIRERYSAMLAASPTPPAEQQAPTLRRVERTTFPNSPAHRATHAFVSAMHDNHIKGDDMRAAMLWFLGYEECDAALQQAAPKAAPDHPPMPENWGVVVSVNSENILCIGQDYLHGKRELSEAEELAIVGMAQHLLAFVGYGLPPSIFDPDDDAAPKQEAQEPCGWPADRVRIEKTEKNGWCAYLDIQDEDGNRTGTINLCRGIDTENAARALAQNWVREFVPAPAPLSEQDERRAFEQDFMRALPGENLKRKFGHYEDPRTRHRWDGWKARAALAAQGGQ